MKSGKAIAEETALKLDEKWKKLLVERDLAEFNRKTAEWEFRDIKDVAQGFMLAQSDADLPKSTVTESEALIPPVPKTVPKKSGSRR